MPLALPVSPARCCFAKAALGRWRDHHLCLVDPRRDADHSAAIYAYTQVPGGDGGALRLSLVAVLISLGALVVSEWLVRRSPLQVRADAGLRLRTHPAGFTFDARFETSGGLTALFGRSGSNSCHPPAGRAGAGQPRTSLDDTVMLDGDRSAPAPHKRGTGSGVCRCAAVPLSVAANLAYGRWFRRIRAQHLREPVVEALGIGHLLRRMPATLSGGERQRAWQVAGAVRAPRPTCC